MLFADSLTELQSYLEQTDWNRVPVAQQALCIRLRHAHSFSFDWYLGPLAPFGHVTLLDMSSTSVLHLSSAIGRLTQLAYLYLRNCVHLLSIDTQIGLLVHLRELDLAGCEQLAVLPPTMDQLTELRVLNCDECFSLQAASVECIMRLPLLAELTLMCIGRAANVRYWFSRLPMLEILSVTRLEKFFFFAIGNPESYRRLRTISFVDCPDFCGMQAEVSEKMICLDQIVVYHCPQFGGMAKVSTHTPSLSSFKAIGQTNLTDAPSYLLQCQAISHVSLNGTYIVNGDTALEALTALVRLITLELHNWSTLLALPVSIGGLQLLRTLEITKSRIKAVPPAIGGLVSLRVLRLVHNEDLRYLSDNIGDLAMLEELDLTGTQVQHAILPASIGRLSRLQLLRLGAGLAGIAAIDTYPPTTAVQLSGLQNLTALTYTNDETLHDFEDSGLPASLESLTLYDIGKLTALPDNFGQLRRLNDLFLNGVALTSLPQSFAQLSSLGQLCFHNCYHLTSLPSGCFNLPSLAALVVHRCDVLTGIPPIDVSVLSALRSLLISKTPIPHLPQPVSALTSLCQLELAECLITALPDDLWRLQTLSSVKVRDCANLCDFGEVSRVPGRAIELLHIVGCTALPRLPNSFGCFEQIEHLRVVDCLGLTQLPESIGAIICNDIDLSGCHGLTELPVLMHTHDNVYIFDCLGLRDNDWDSHRSRLRAMYQKRLLVENLILRCARRRRRGLPALSARLWDLICADFLEDLF